MILIACCLTPAMSRAEMHDVSQASAARIASGKIEVRVITPASAQDTMVTFTANMTRAGQLAQLLGDNIYKVDSLVVTGPVDDSDFNTMYNATYNGRLTALNLRQAVVASGIIPDHAFFPFRPI